MSRRRVPDRVGDRDARVRRDHRRQDAAPAARAAGGAVRPDAGALQARDRLRGRPEEVPARRAAGRNHARADLLGVRRPDDRGGRAVRSDVRRELGPSRLRGRPAPRPRILPRARPTRTDRDRRRGLHALPATDRPHPAPVRHAARGAALSRYPPLGGHRDPLLHPVHRGRGAAVRRGPPGRERHRRQRAGLRAGERGGGQRARRPQPLVGADRQRGRMVAALHDGPRSSCASCRCPSTSTSSRRFPTCSSGSSRRAARSGRWRSRT